MLSALQPRGASISLQLLRLLQPALRTAGQHTLAAAGGTAPPPLLTAADHDKLRRDCQTGVELVKAVHEVPESRRMFMPPPNSQLCHSMAFNYSYFFRGHAISPDLLKQALQTLEAELPHLAGRGRVLGSGSRVADCAIECNNEGIELATAAAPQVRLQDVGPHTWSVLTAGYPLESTPLPFYAQPPSHVAATKGLEPPLRLRLTNLADGQVLSASFWHILADAGRGVKLLDRLSEHYRAAAQGRPVSSEGALTSDTRLFHSPADLMNAMAEEPPKDWTSQHRANDKMTPWQWATAPWKMVQWGRRRYDVHLVYLPSPLLRRIKQAISQESGGVRVSTNDAVQGVLFALCSDLRGRPLVPPPGQFATTNSDLLHGLSLKEQSLQQRYFGNAVQALKPSGTAEDGAWAHKATPEERFIAAAATNARLIRQAITDFRKDVRGTLDALDELDQMASMPKLKLMANWVVKLGDLKTSAASSMAKFPLHTADFGGGGPLYMQCEMVPWYDWWSLLMPAAGIDDGQGMLVRTVMGAGLGRQLAEHHVWRRGGLLHGAQLRLAGQPGAPLGGLVEQPTMDADAPAPKKQAVAGRRAEVWDEDSQPVAAWVHRCPADTPEHHSSVGHGSSEEELAEFREGVRTFAKEVVAPHAAEIDRLNAYPPRFEFWGAAGEMGLHGITVPAEQGGLGLGYLHHCIAMEELSRASGSVALSYGAHTNLCINQLVRNASQEQLAKYLPKLLSGEHVGALAMSEPNAGSDVVSMRCRAEKKDGYYVLNGSKMWITNGPIASTLIVYAKTQPDAGAHGITAFIIERGMKGFTTAQKLDKLGMRGSDTCELLFDNCEVPAENVLGRDNQGVYVLMSGLDYERLVLSAGPLGIMQACLDTVLPYTRERTQFGKAIAEFQLVQAKLADMYAATQATRALVYATAREADAGRASRKDCAAAILFAAENATRAALNAIQLLGGNGYTNEYPTGRFLRDAKLYEIGAGTSEIRRILIGRELFKQPSP